ncbi:unnamed protein product [Trichogramma brassicae]|uniref:Poly(A) polymerase n=1 Tax=Trichogramma brassicae TaxID=86971 RepID=A0A6H5I5A3_9HYME|nr:unnamed protein product [Trichogramma brassicae]
MKNSTIYYVICYRKLDSLVKMWIRDVGLSHGMPVEMAEDCGGHVETFGSYRLGVHHRGSDIDALCVVPRHVTRSDYFGSFVKLLRTESEITDIRTIEKAYVPVLKMKFSGIDIDLLFARLELDVIPPKLVSLTRTHTHTHICFFKSSIQFNVVFSFLQDLNNSLLATLDTKCVRSLNGCRVTDQILSLVPNVDAFKLTLRVVRLWAKRNNIYSNILGFLGGVSWAILVAYTCQLYPRHDPAQLIREFFRLFSRWNWPSPVCLRAPEQVNFGFPVWFNNNNNNGGNGNVVGVSGSGSSSSEFGYQEREALMPIITPCYPEQNTTYNVSRSSRRVIVEAFERGYATISAILDNQAPWDTLFEPVVFFGRYKEHVTVFANSTTKHKHLLWCGFIEARIRHLIERLERHKCISVAHVHSESYSPPYGNQGYCSVWYIGLAFDKEDVEVNLQHDLQRFTEITKAQAEQIKLFKADMDLTAIHTKRSNNKEKLVQHDQQNDDNYNNNNDDTVADTTAYLLINQERKKNTTAELASSSTAAVMQCDFHIKRPI